MRIGIYISPAHAVPPGEKNILAPWILAGRLADELVEKGHDVTLFAAKGSTTRARLVHGGIEPTVKRKKAFPDVESYRAYVVSQELALMREVVSAAKAGELDIVHVHQPVERIYPALLAMPATIPVLITFHDPIVPARFAALETLVGLGNIYFVSLSYSQQRGVPFPFVGVVPNGIDLSLFQTDEIRTEIDAPLLITGRIVPEKGFGDAIQAARLAGVRLLVVGQEYEDRKRSHEYFQTVVKPAVDGKTVFWEPVVKRDHLVGHYQTARAFLFPIRWEEPFGLVMIEAMACGTPVIAYDRGSVSEIVRDGLTGYIVDPGDGTAVSDTTYRIKKMGVEGLVEAIRSIDRIDRAVCRTHVEKHFSLEAMIQGYETVYAQVCGMKKKR